MVHIDHSMKTVNELTTSHEHRSGDVDDVQRRSRFAQKGHDWLRIMGVWL